MESLRGRNVLVTGGSRGIGRAAVLAFADAGARVAIHYARDAHAAEATAAEARALGAEAFTLAADLHAAAPARALVDAAAERLGGLDAVVVNHGIWKPAPLTDMTDAQWDETLAVNLTSAWAVCQQAARHLVPRRRGAIVTIASTAGQRGEAGYAHYAASKGGLIALTRSLAAELAPAGVRVNGVAPGWVATDMTREALAAPEAIPSVARIPRGRPGTPEEIAAAVVFLASDRASYLYGEVLSVNGGAVMYD
ncbi:MAG: 3-oxoacyl-ACP reductase FabG [Vicinamibacteria bacterium]